MPEEPLGGEPPVASSFLFEVDGVEIGAFKEVTGLEISVATVEYAEGGQNQYLHRLPGVVRWPNLVLRRGLVNSDAPFAWVGKTSGDGFAANENRLTRASGAVTVVDNLGTRLRAWELEGVFAVRWTGPRLSVDVAEALVETLEVAHNGFRSATS